MALNSSCKGCGTRLGPEDNDGPITQPDHCRGCRIAAAKAARAEANRRHPSAVAGRQQKAIAMVAFIDRKALAKGLSPYDQAGRILLATLEWDDETWATIGAGSVKPTGGFYERKPISAETRELVRSVYRSRAAAPVDQRVAS